MTGTYLYDDRQNENPQIYLFKVNHKQETNVQLYLKFLLK